MYKRHRYLIVLSFLLLFAANVVGQDIGKEEDTTEEKSTTAEDNIKFQFDSLQIAKNSKDYERMTKIYDELILEHPYVIYEKKMLLLVVIKDIIAQSKEFKEYWDSYWSIELDSFLLGGVGDLSLLAKSLFNRDKEIIEKNLLMILVESGHVFDMAKAIKMSELYDINKEEWVEQLNKAALRVVAPESQNWLVSGEYADLIEADNKVILRKKIQQRSKTTVWPEVVKGWRPSADYNWKVPQDPIDIVTRSYNYFNFINRVPTSPKRIHGQIKFAARNEKGDCKLLTVDEVTGRLIREQLIKNSMSGKLAAHFSLECPGAALDIACWSNMNRSLNFKTDLLMSDMSGQLLWKNTFENMFEKEDRFVMSGEPMLVHNIIILPLTDLTLVTQSGGSYSQGLAAIDVETGRLRWYKVLKQHHSKVDYFRLFSKDPINMLNQSGVLWLESGENEISALDLFTGEVVFKKDFNPKQSQKNKPEKLNAMFMRYDRNKEPDNFKGCLFAADGHVIFQSGSGTHLYLLDGASGKVLDSYANGGVVFLQKHKEGLLFYEKDRGFVLLSGISQGLFRDSRCGVDHRFIVKVKEVLPWGNGCLISNGQDLFQINFEKNVSRVFPQRVMPFKDRHMTVVNKKFYSFNQSGFEQKKLWLSDKKRASSIWVNGQKTSRNFKLVLEVMLRDDDWEGAKSFLGIENVGDYVDREIVDLLSRKGISFLLNNETKRSEWIFDFLKKISPSNVLANRMIQLFDQEEVDLKKDTFLSQDNDYLIAMSAICNVVLGREVGGNVTSQEEQVKNIKNSLIFSSQRQLEDRQLSETVNDRVVLLEDEEKYYRVMDKKFVDFPGKILAWSTRKMFFEKDKYIVAYNIDDKGQLSDVLWKSSIHTFKWTSKDEFTKSLEVVEERKDSASDLFQVNPSVKKSQVYLRSFGSYLLLQNKYTVSCLVAATGKYLWTRSFQKRPHMEVSYVDDVSLFLFTCDIHVNSNLLNKGELFKIDLMTGKMIWDIKLLSEIPLPMRDTGDDIVIFDNIFWSVIDKRSGNQKKIRPDVSRYFEYKKGKVYGDNNFVFISNDNKQCVVMDRRGAIVPLDFQRERDRKAQKEAWKKNPKKEIGNEKNKVEDGNVKPVKKASGFFVHEKNVIYDISSEEKQITAVDTETGKLLGKIPFPKELTQRSKVMKAAVLAGDIYFILNVTGQMPMLYLCDVSEKSIKSLNSNEKQSFDDIFQGSTFISIIEKKGKHVVYFYCKK